MQLKSTRDLKDAINRGTFINNPVTSKDVNNSIAIFGPDQFDLRGKSTRKKATIHSLEPSSYTAQREQRLSGDLMYVFGLAVPLLKLSLLRAILPLEELSTSTIS